MDTMREWVLAERLILFVGGHRREVAMSDDDFISAILALFAEDREKLVAALEEAKELLEWTEDDDWWCEPGFKERRDAWLKQLGGPK